MSFRRLCVTGCLAVASVTYGQTRDHYLHYGNIVVTKPTTQWIVDSTIEGEIARAYNREDKYFSYACVKGKVVYALTTNGKTKVFNSTKAFISKVSVSLTPEDPKLPLRNLTDVKALAHAINQPADYQPSIYYAGYTWHLTNTTANRVTLCVI